MGKEIHQVGVRAGLKPRREPYWAPSLGTNESMGYRKIDAARGSWVARRKESGRKTYKALGPETAAFGFIQAREVARKWFANQAIGIEVGATVAAACGHYVASKVKQGEANAAHDAKKRFERTVNEAPIGEVLLVDLRKHHLQAWVDAEKNKTKPATLKRNWTSLLAALNMAIDDQLASKYIEQAWVGLKFSKVPDNRRSLFLDLKQRRALLAAARGSVRDLIEGIMLTGCRAGELTGASVSQFDVRTGVFKINYATKTGARHIPLSNSAIELFKRLSKSKLPLGLLFTRDDGKRWAHSDWDELVRGAAKEAGLPVGTCLYTLRHSWITEAIGGGLNILEVARMVGTSVMMVERHYGHLVHSVARERLAKVMMT